MVNYQDLLKVPDRTQDKIDFVHRAIQMHKNTDLYNIAVIADQYDRQKNPTIVNYQKLLYTVTGKAVVDNYSANYKMTSGFFNRFTTQENQYLLGNGITWQEESTKQALGNDFENEVQNAGKMALVGGVAFGFWNYDHLETFGVSEFAPLYDEENGALRAGIRFWQVASNKPLRATLYEEDGYTDYIWISGTGSVLNEKRSYIINLRVSEVDGTEIYDGDNYDTFPIVPLWANPQKQSELIGIRESIDAYDLIKSGFANDIDDASMIYWTIQNASGMDDIDLVKFVEHMKTVKAAVVEEDGAKAEAHTMDIPYNAREAILERLEKDLYKDYMALDTEKIAGGAVTATQIKAAYEPLNNKVDQYEYCVRKFLQGILNIAGIEDTPTFTRSKIVNVSEEIQAVLSVAGFVDEEYLTKKILTLLGDGDMADEVINRMDANAVDRFTSDDVFGTGNTE